MTLQEQYELETNKSPLQIVALADRYVTSATDEYVAWVENQATAKRDDIIEDIAVALEHHNYYLGILDHSVVDFIRARKKI